LKKKINIIKDAPQEVCSLINNNLKKINEIYTKPKIFENYLFKNVLITKDKEWLKEFRSEFKLKNATEKLQLLYDIYLSQQGLYIEFPEGETPIEFKKIKKL